MGKIRQLSSAARSSRKVGSKLEGLRGRLVARGDRDSLFASELIAILQDRVHDQGQEIRKLKGEPYKV